MNKRSYDKKEFPRKISAEKEIKLPKCIRCGTCCILGTCGYGKEDEFGICKELIVHKDLTTSCKIIKRAGEFATFVGAGCYVRRNTSIFEALVSMNDITAAKKWIRGKREQKIYSKLNLWKWIKKGINHVRTYRKTRAID